MPVVASLKQGEENSHHNYDKNERSKSNTNQRGTKQSYNILPNKAA
jgi:hypothetical protein